MKIYFFYNIRNGGRGWVLLALDACIVENEVKKIELECL